MTEHQWQTVESTGPMRAEECVRCNIGKVSVNEAPWEYYVPPGAWYGYQEPVCDPEKWASG